MRRFGAAVATAVLFAGLFGACEPLEPLLPPGASIVGVVCDSLTGRPRRDAEVTCRAMEREIEVDTDGDGFFRCEPLNAVEGEALVFVDEGGEREPRAFRVAIEAGERSQLSDTACREPPGLPGIGDVDGRVCNRHTGELIEHATVSLVLMVNGAEEVRTQESSGAPDAGRFFFRDVPVGEWPLIIEAPGYQRSLVVVVEEGETFEVDLGVCTKDIPGEGEGEGEGEGPTGSAHGHVCMFDGTGLAGATVTTTLADGTVRTATTDSNGDWQMDDLPPGAYTFHIEAGAFTAERTAEVTADTVVTLPSEDCELDQDDVKIAVIEGSWDDVYSVLMHVGVDPSIVDAYPSYGGPLELFSDPALLATYDAVLINCGADEYDWQSDVVMQQNLSAYVLSGGSVYASDLAYDFAERIFPSFVDFMGDDASYSAAEIGLSGDIAGTILDPVLSAAVGTSNISLHYPYGSWAIVLDVSADVRVLIRGDAPYDDWSTGAYGTAPNVPHTLMYRPGGASGGKVVFSSFHQEPGINVQQEQILQLLMFQL